MTKKIIVAFDFDDTLITKDTLIDFIRFSCSPFAFLYKSARFLPTLLGMKLKKTDNQTAKERLLAIFFSGMSLNDFDTLSSKYVGRLDGIVNHEALQKLEQHQAQGHEVVIVSASIENWIRPWATTKGIKTVIASKLRIEKNRVTGQLDGKNCHGHEKVVRFLATYPRRDDYTLIVYGDGKSDQELFQLADKYYEGRFN